MFSFYKIAKVPNMRILLTAMSAVCVAGQANAATVLQTQEFSNSYFNTYSQTVEPDFSGRNVATDRIDITLFDTTVPGGQFDYFDASLGTLEQVTLTFSGVNDSNSGFEIRSLSCSGVLAGCTSSSTSGIGFSRYRTVLELTNPFTISAGGSGSGLVQTVGDFTPFMDMGSFSDTETFTGAGVNQFVGTGFFDVQPLFEPQIILSVNCATDAIFGLDDCNARGRTSYGAQYTVSLTYQYDDGAITPPVPAVPLPASAPFLFAALGGLAVLRRRKKN